MPTGIVIKQAERAGFPIICQHDKCDIGKEEIEDRLKFLGRKDFINVISRDDLEKIFPPDSTLAGIDVELADDHVLIRPAGMNSIFINGRHLPEGHYHAVNISADDSLQFSLDNTTVDCTISAFLVD